MSGEWSEEDERERAAAFARLDAAIPEGFRSVEGVASRVDERRIAEIVDVLDRAGVPTEGIVGPYTVAQRVAILARWSKPRRVR